MGGVSHPSRAGRRADRDDLDGLVTFLLARVLEDETTALSAIGSGEVVEIRAKEHVIRHMTRHDPDRVLREARAKRAIVDVWATGARAAKFGHAPVDQVPDAVIVHLASAYSDHPDFDGNWLDPVISDREAARGGTGRQAPRMR